MSKYINAKIYVIKSPDSDRYIGSTISSLSVRFSTHKSEYKRWKDHKIGNVTIFQMFEKYGVDNCKIELIENYPCNSKKELERREGELIKSTEKCVNKLVAGRTQQEYHKDNLQKRRDANRRWREENPKKNKERWTRYYSENSEKKKEQAKIYGKEYRQKNREKERLRQETYRENKRALLNLEQKTSESTHDLIRNACPHRNTH